MGLCTAYASQGWEGHVVLSATVRKTPADRANLLDHTCQFSLFLAIRHQLLRLICGGSDARGSQREPRALRQSSA